MQEYRNGSRQEVYTLEMTQEEEIKSPDRLLEFDLSAELMNDTALDGQFNTSVTRLNSYLGIAGFQSACSCCRFDLHAFSSLVGVPFFYTVLAAQWPPLMIL